MPEFCGNISFSSLPRRQEDWTGLFRLDMYRYMSIINFLFLFPNQMPRFHASFLRGRTKILRFVFPCLQAEVAAVVMTGGLAHVCLVTSHMTVTRARIEMNIPRKRAGSSDHRKAISRFYEAVYQVWFLPVGCFGGDFAMHVQQYAPHIGTICGSGTAVPGDRDARQHRCATAPVFPGGRTGFQHTGNVDRLAARAVCLWLFSVPPRTGDRTARQLPAGQVFASGQPRVCEGRLL